jgi:hypothetical protein
VQEVSKQAREAPMMKAHEAPMTHASEVPVMQAQDGSSATLL